MTDAEAKREVEHYMRWGIFGHPPSHDALRHALQAIEDRAAIIRAYEVDGWSTGVADAARRHMKGE